MAICDHLGLPRSQIGWTHPDIEAPNYHVYKMTRKALVDYGERPVEKNKSA
jgi:hypothetical protein